MLVQESSPKQLIRKFNQLTKSMPPLDSEAMKVLQRICRKDVNFFKKYGDYELTPSGPYIYMDRGSDILGVAHLDVRVKAHHFSVTNLSHDKEIKCPTLDDRLGVFILLHMLPLMGIECDILLTTGEENGQSTAQYFTPPTGKDYKWMFEFDREGTDAVLYNYYNWELKTLLERAGWTVGYGSYSDICELEHLRIMGINFGTGYHRSHTLDMYASVSEILLNLKKFDRFFKKNCDTKLPFLPRYNIWTPEDGFAFLYKPGSIPYQDTFTEVEIELLETLDYEGIEFSKSRITPLDIRLQAQEALGRPLSENPEPIEELNLFTNLTEVDDIKIDKDPRPKMKVTNVSLALGLHIGPSEDEHLIRARKPGESALVIHSEGDDLSKAETFAIGQKLQGKQTVGPMIHTSGKKEKAKIHRDINACFSCNGAGFKDKAMCKSCKGTGRQKDRSSTSESKIRVVANIPLGGRIKDDEERKEYVQLESGQWEWKGEKRKSIKLSEAIF
jgi:hypothetical protein